MQEITSEPQARRFLGTFIRTSVVTQPGVLAALEGKIEQSITVNLRSDQISGPQNTSSSSVEPIAVTMDTRPNTHAGSRIPEIYELLELCLLDLPIKDLLLAQRVSKRFHAIINTSPRLREKLFFTSRLAFGNAFRAKLNPLIVREEVIVAIPLFFDHKEQRLACCYEDGFTRLYCRSITATTVWVYLEFSEEEPRDEISGEGNQTKILEKGSWERMFVSQPSCFVSWRVQLNRPARETYSGIVKGARTMGSLMEGLVGSSLVVRR